jgi:hypothetical protein
MGLGPLHAALSPRPVFSPSRKVFMRSPTANDGCILPANQSLILLRSTPIILAMYVLRPCFSSHHFFKSESKRTTSGSAGIRSRISNYEEYAKSFPVILCYFCGDWIVKHYILGHDPFRMMRKMDPVKHFLHMECRVLFLASDHWTLGV